MKVIEVVLSWVKKMFGFVNFDFIILSYFKFFSLFGTFRSGFFVFGVFLICLLMLLIFLDLFYVVFDNKVCCVCVGIEEVEKMEEIMKCS